MSGKTLSAQITLKGSNYTIQLKSYHWTVPGQNSVYKWLFLETIWNFKKNKKWPCISPCLT